jgi:hypothetical protein
MRDAVRKCAIERNDVNIDIEIAAQRLAELQYRFLEAAFLWPELPYDMGDSRSCGHG